MGGLNLRGPSRSPASPAPGLTVLATPPLPALPGLSAREVRRGEVRGCGGTGRLRPAYDEGTPCAAWTRRRSFPPNGLFRVGSRTSLGKPRGLTTTMESALHPESNRCCILPRNTVCCASVCHGRMVPKVGRQSFALPAGRLRDSVSPCPDPIWPGLVVFGDVSLSAGPRLHHGRMAKSSAAGSDRLPARRESDPARAARQQGCVSRTSSAVVLQSRARCSVAPLRPSRSRTLSSGWPRRIPGGATPGSAALSPTLGNRSAATR
jgi:hypothetical protein